jgi:hypothetical protein
MREINIDLAHYRYRFTPNRCRVHGSGHHFKLITGFLA